MVGSQNKPTFGRNYSNICAAGRMRKRSPRVDTGTISFDFLITVVFEAGPLPITDYVVSFPAADSNEPRAAGGIAESQVPARRCEAAAPSP